METSFWILSTHINTGQTQQAVYNPAYGGWKTGGAQVNWLASLYG